MDECWTDCVSLLFFFFAGLLVRHRVLISIVFARARTQLAGADGSGLGSVVGVVMVLCFCNLMHEIKY